MLERLAELAAEDLTPDELLEAAHRTSRERPLAVPRPSVLCRTTRGRDEVARVDVDELDDEVRVGAGCGDQQPRTDLQAVILSKAS